MIRVLVADDQDLIRQALQLYLEQEQDIEVVISVNDGIKAIEQVEKLNPDVALLDLEMPGLDGLTATKIINQRFPQTKVLVLSSHESIQYVNQALQAGAKGYLNKSTSAEELANAIRSIYQGYGELELEPQAQPLNNLHLEPELGTIATSFPEQKFELLLQKTQQELGQRIVTERQEIQTKLIGIIDQKISRAEQDLREEIKEDIDNFRQEVEQGLRLFQQKVVKQMQDDWNELRNFVDSANNSNENFQEHKMIRIQLMQLRESHQKLENQLSLAYKLFLLSALSVMAFLFLILYF